MGEPIEGTSGSGVADDGRPPIKVGGIFKVAQPVYTDGQRGDLSIDGRGSLHVVLSTPDSTAVAAAQASTDSQGSSALLFPTYAELMVFNGVNWDRRRVSVVFKPISSLAIVAGTGATIWTPAVGKKFRLMGYSLSSSAAASLIFGDNLVGTVIFRGPLLGIAGVDNRDDLGNGILSAAANNVLKLDVSASTTVTGTVWGTEE